MTCGAKAHLPLQLCHAAKTYLHICHTLTSPDEQEQISFLKIIRTFSPPTKFWDSYLFFKTNLLHQNRVFLFTSPWAKLFSLELAARGECLPMELDSSNVRWGSIKHRAVFKNSKNQVRVYAHTCSLQRSLWLQRKRKEKQNAY